MATTPLGFPYGTLDDPPDGASQEQALATAVDTYLTGHYFPAASILMGRSTTLTLTSSTPTSPASFDVGVLSQHGTDVVYAGSGVIQAKIAGLYWWHATINWPDTTLAHRRKISVQVNGTNFGTGARTAWIFGAATGDTDTAGGLIPISQTNVDAGGAVKLVLYQSSSADMTGAGAPVPASFGLVRVG